MEDRPVQKGRADGKCSNSLIQRLTHTLQDACPHAMPMPCAHGGEKCRKCGKHLHHTVQGNVDPLSPNARATAAAANKSKKQTKSPTSPKAKSPTGGRAKLQETLKEKLLSRLNPTGPPSSKPK